MKKYIVILSMLMNCFLTSGQDISSFTPRDYSIIPPSPEVSALMKYIDIPVSPFTGQPDITLPLYTVKAGSLEVPISISYHGGGIKLNEHPGIVGLGWNLNAGGCVSRTVYGYPDEAPMLDGLHMGWNSNSCHVRGLFHLNQIEKDSLRNRVMNRMVIDYSVDQHFENAIPYAYCSTYDSGIIDVANDIYHFNFLGNSGTFIIDPVSSNKIVSTASNVCFDSMLTPMATSTQAQFVMFDDLHTKYVFSTREETYMPYHYRSGLSEWVNDSLYYISAWHLKEIISIQGDTIRFSYLPAMQRKEFLGVYESYTGLSSNYYSEGERKTGGNSVVYYGRLLSKIETKSAEVLFDYSNDGTRLCEISVYAKENEPRLIKRYKFHHSQMLIAIEQLNPESLVKEIRKMALTGISEHSNTSVSDSVMLYSFYYNDGVLTPMKKFQYCQDEWGYFNGRQNNESLLKTIYSQSADRTPSSDWAEKGILRRIHFASGGETDLTWEQNDVGKITYGGIAQPDTSISTETIETKLRGKSAPDYPTFAQHLCSSDYFDTSTSYYLDRDTVIRLDFSHYVKPLMQDGCVFQAWNEYFNDHTGFDAPTSYPRLELYGPGQTRLARWHIDSITSQKGVFSYYLNVPENRKGFYRFILKHPYNFDDPDINNNDIFSFFAGGTETSSTRGYVSIITTKKNVVIHSEGNYWGGLRIKQIQSYENATNEATTKIYEYKEPFIGKSTGAVRESPSYFSNFYYTDESRIGGINGINYDEYITESSNGIYSTPMGTAQVEYSSVLEKFKDDSLRVQYVYDSQESHDLCDEKEVSIDFIPAAHRIYTSRAYKRGNLIQKNYLIGDSLYRTDSIAYRIIDADNGPVFCTDFTKFLEVELLTPTQAHRDYATSCYHLIPFNKGVSSVVTKEYQPQTWYMIDEDTENYRTATDYTYFTNTYNSEPSASFVRSERRLDSDGDSTTTFYTYRTYQDGDHTYYLNLREAEVTVKNGNVISGRRNVYDSCNRLIGTYRCRTGIPFSQLGMQNYYYSTPTAVYAAMNVPEYTYQYDNDGNLVEISYNGTVLASYLWGYKGSHPIAEIKGVSYTELCTSLPQLLQPSALLNRYDLTESDLNTIRTTFAGHDVTTLTYNWLIGAGTMTDPRGVTTRFTYDGYGRLDSVKDFNDYLIKKYQYHYANQ